MSKDDLEETTDESGETEIFFRLPVALKEDAKRRAEEEERSLSGYLRDLIRKDVLSSTT